ncbi:hypothetical protein UFOVP1020_26 [uncultured Caudovirales phage]|uniref:Uncharacterized protein n=1 Tax=uncultured Caudovirales phage TaxID=2100421 RepID=A0A6J5QZC8_9CAUD|nr:hypothetical protein UFOVP512_31 [uncultured Caudovirales phage]CAB4178685.1 hypothetical protein UFOVP1020_26 [uncultured Caudovirales phage]CAB4187957.1 hypothetical protein UFOVP1170_21 [uncultured Caudovirales phage]CAB4220386.1 hypothetical protein UFOVP1621_24 [uncultured Caudovirales phage]
MVAEIAMPKNTPVDVFAFQPFDGGAGRMMFQKSGVE